MTSTQAEVTRTLVETASDYPIDDMLDDPADRELTRDAPPLYAALACIDEQLLSRYREHVERALTSQKRYRFGIFVTAWGGTLAVLGAVAQLVFELMRMHASARGAADLAMSLHAAAQMALKFEALLIVMTLIGVVTGIRLSQLENWLLDHFKAEQLRLLKFRFLLDPRLWGSEEERATWNRDLVKQRDAILAVTRPGLAHESERDVLPNLPTHGERVAVDQPGLQVLLEYYRRTRLEAQRRYFARASKHGTSALDNPRLLPWFFFGSVVLVALHVGIEQTMIRIPGILDDSTDMWTNASLVLVGLSVGLPVAWAGIRTWRSARESTRNVARSAARLHMLSDIAASYDALGKVDTTHALCRLQLLELVLESDQREWLRLMREVEWYG